MRNFRQYSFWGFNTSNVEIIDLLKAWAAISIAFAVVLRGLSFDYAFFLSLIISSVTVGTGFLLHELAHKVVAQRYGCFAEFRADDKMLIFAVLLSVFGFVFAAPGAVMISGYIDLKKNGHISIAGPLTNIILAAIFFAVLNTTAFFPQLWRYGFSINAWLALFNLIPLWNFDGKKILNWNRTAWLSMVVISVLLVFFI